MDQQAITDAAIQYIEGEQDESFANEVRELLGRKRWDELEDRFYTDLEFGTGGLRGVDRRWLQSDEPVCGRSGDHRARAVAS